MPEEEIVEIENEEKSNKKSEINTSENRISENSNPHPMGLHANVDASNLPSFLKINRHREETVFGPKQRRHTFAQSKNKALIRFSSIGDNESTLLEIKNIKGENENSSLEKTLENNTGKLPTSKGKFLKKPSFFGT